MPAPPHPEAGHCPEEAPPGGALLNGDGLRARAFGLLSGNVTRYRAWPWHPILALPIGITTQGVSMHGMALRRGTHPATKEPNRPSTPRPSAGVEVVAHVGHGRSPPTGSRRAGGLVAGMPAWPSRGCESRGPHRDAGHRKGWHEGRAAPAHGRGISGARRGQPGLERRRPGGGGVRSPTRPLVPRRLGGGSEVVEHQASDSCSPLPRLQADSPSSTALKQS